MSARFLLAWEDLRGCWLFVLLSIASCALPTLLASLFRWVRFQAWMAVWGTLETALSSAECACQLPSAAHAGLPG